MTARNRKGEVKVRIVNAKKQYLRRVPGYKLCNTAPCTETGRRVSGDCDRTDSILMFADHYCPSPRQEPGFLRKTDNPRKISWNRDFQKNDITEE
jgi:hypothetical protein